MELVGQVVRLDRYKSKKRIGEKREQLHREKITLTVE